MRRWGPRWPTSRHGALCLRAIQGLSFKLDTRSPVRLGRPQDDDAERVAAGGGPPPAAGSRRRWPGRSIGPMPGWSRAARSRIGWRSPALGWSRCRQGRQAASSGNVPAPQHEQHEITITLGAVRVATRFIVASDHDTPAAAQAFDLVPSRSIPPCRRSLRTARWFSFHGHSSGAEKRSSSFLICCMPGARRART